MKQQITTRWKTIFSVSIGLIFFTGCSGQPNLNQMEVVATSQQCFSKMEMASIMTIPSRGLAGDGLALGVLKITGADGGFAEDFKSNISKGIKQIVVYSVNNLKSSEYLVNAISKFNDNSLKNIELCYIGDKEYSLKIEKEAKRVGASYKNISDLNSTNGSSLDLGLLPSKSNNGGLMEQIKSY